MVNEKNKDPLSLANWLSKITFITSTGDFTSLFVYGVIFSDLENNAISAASVLSWKGIGILLGSIIFYANSKRMVNHRKLIFLAQFALAFLTLSTALFWNLGFLNRSITIIIWVFQSLLAQIFTMSRDSYSKILEEAHLVEHDFSKTKKSSIWFVIQNEAGPMFGQAIGPIIFLILIHFFKFSLVTPLIIDAFTFAIAAIMALKLPLHNELKTLGTNIFEKIELRSVLRQIFPLFITRVLFLNAGLSIFNAVIFDLIPRNYDLDVSYTGIVYSVIGICAATTSAIIGYFQFTQKKLLFCIGSLGYILGSFVFGFYTNIYTGIFGCICVGAGNALQRIGSRSYLRDLLNYKSHDRIIALEYLAMRIVEIVVVFTTSYFINQGVNTIVFVYLCCLLMLLICPMSFLWPTLKPPSVQRGLV